MVDCIKAIGQQVKAVSSFETKVNALETLRKIAKTILLSNDILGHEVGKQFQSESVLVETSEAILEMMSPGDRVLAGNNVSEPGKGTLLDKMKWVRATADSHVIEGLKVSNMCNELEGEDKDDDSDEEDDEEEAEQQGYGGLAKDLFDFDTCAAEVDFVINHKHSSLSGSKQYEKAFGVFSESQSQIRIVEKNAGPSEFGRGSGCLIHVR